MTVTKRQWQVLRTMQEQEAAENYEDAEIVCDKGQCWLGDERISARTVNELLLWIAITEHDEGKGVRRYTISGTGKAALDDHAVPERVRDCVARGINCDQAGNPIA